MINFEAETRALYTERLRSYENNPMSYEQAKVAIADWIKWIEDSLVKLIELHNMTGVEYDEAIKSASFTTINNEIKKVMLISLYGFDAFMDVVSQIKEYEPETILDVIEAELSRKIYK